MQRGHKGHTIVVRIGDIVGGHGRRAAVVDGGGGQRHLGVYALLVPPIPVRVVRPGVDMNRYYTSLELY